MNLPLELVIACKPKEQPRTKSNRFTGRHYTPDDDGSLEAFKHAVLRSFRKTAGEQAQPVETPVFVRIVAYFPRKKTMLKKRSTPTHAILMTGKPDCDNLAKSVLDALTITNKMRSAHKKLGKAVLGYPWIDDAQVHLDGVLRYYCASDSQPGVVITLRAPTTNEERGDV